MRQQDHTTHGIMPELIQAITTDPQGTAQSCREIAQEWEVMRDPERHGRFIRLADQLDIYAVLVAERKLKGRV